jgi:adenine-specific DNA-methyltransferase
MGNKRALAAEVATVCEGLNPDRPLVDLFGGMCCVAGAVASTGRRVHVNDIQSYAELAARCLVATPQLPPTSAEVERMLGTAFISNRRRLNRRFAAALRRERNALGAATPLRLAAAFADWPHAASDPEIAAEVAALHNEPIPPHRLCTLTFAWSYFGLAQSIEIDSLRFAIDSVAPSPTHTRWLRLALLQTASRVASTPGHFAQFLRPASQAATARIVACRRRSVWDWFLQDVDTLRPYGNAAWRRRNKVSRSDALKLVEGFAQAPERSIFYADPPYSKEHYSRFYHVLETLERYDYPSAVGAGRYRPDRFRSDFAVGSTVLEATNKLLATVAGMGGTLLFSYPSKGLLTCKEGVAMPELLAAHFDEVRLVVDRPAHHSTLGGRHGAPTRSVREHVWLAQ